MVSVIVQTFLAKMACKVVEYFEENLLMNLLFLSAIVISWLLCYGIAVISFLISGKSAHEVPYQDLVMNAFAMFALSWIFGIIVYFILDFLGLFLPVSRY